MAPSTLRRAFISRCGTPRSPKPSTIVRAATPRRNQTSTERRVIEAVPGQPTTPRRSSMARTTHRGASCDDLDRASFEHARSGYFRKADAIKAEMATMKAQREEALREEQRAERFAFLRDKVGTQAKELWDFKKSWSQKMAMMAQQGEAALRDFDERMREAHQKELQRLRAETEPKSPRWSRDYLQLRKQQGLLVDQQRYDEAGSLRAIADKLEAKEQQAWHASRDTKIATSEAQWLARARGERAGLQARIVAGQLEVDLLMSQERQRLLKRFQCVKAQSAKIAGNVVEKGLDRVVYAPQGDLGPKGALSGCTPRSLKGDVGGA